MLLTSRMRRQSTSLSWSSASNSFFLSEISSYSASSPNWAACSSPSAFNRSSSASALARESDSSRFCLCSSSMRDSRMAALSAAAVRSCLMRSSREATSEVCLSASSLRRLTSWSRLALKALNMMSEQSENFFMRNSRPVCTSSLKGHFLRQNSQKVSNSLTSSPMALNSPALSLRSTFSNSRLMKVLVSVALRVRMSSSTFSILRATILAISLRNWSAWSLLSVRLSNMRSSCSLRLSCRSSSSLRVAGMESVMRLAPSSASRSTASRTSSHSRAHTYFQPVWTSGNFLLLISPRQICMRSTRMAALISLPFMRLVLMLQAIILRKSSTCSVNSGRSWSRSRQSSFCSSCSLVRGRTKVKQVRLRKEARMAWRMRLRTSPSPPCPGWAASEFYRYLLAVRGLLSRPTRAREKSRSTQQKSGKSLQSSERIISHSRSTRPRESIAGSSMAPMVLQMKMELRRRVMLNSRRSWLTSSSVDPRPSESITTTLIISSLSFLKMSGLPQTQMPFVLGLVVGPTANPPFCFRMIVFRRQLFPVRYMPATEMIAIFPSIDFKNASASGFTSYSPPDFPLPSLRKISGIALSQYFFIQILCLRMSRFQRTRPIYYFPKIQNQAIPTNIQPSTFIHKLQSVNKLTIRCLPHEGPRPVGLSSPL